jgi:zinc protease
MTDRDRSLAPESGPIRDFKAPSVIAESLDNGLKIKVARSPQVPVVTVSLVLDAGEDVLGADRAGLAVLTGDSLEGGTTRWPGSELAAQLENNGTGLSIDTDWDCTTVSLSCLAIRLDTVLGILAEVVLNPLFPADEVSRFVSQELALIEQRKMSPGSVATQCIRKAVYGDMHYGRPLGGTEESLSMINSDRVTDFWKERYVPGGSGLVVVGDVDMSEIKDLSSKYFSDWKGIADRRSHPTQEPVQNHRKMFLVDRPGSVQSEIRIGHVGQDRESADYFPLMIANTILGGAFTSRLNANLREKNGFTYGVRSSFQFRRGAGPWGVSAAVGTDVTADAVREAVFEVEKFVSEGPTEEEMESSRDYIAGVFPLRFETTDHIASHVVNTLVYGLPDDYYQSHREKVRMVTGEHVRQAVSRCIRPEEMTIVVVGDAENIKAPLSDLGWGEPEILE